MIKVLCRDSNCEMFEVEVEIPENFLMSPSEPILCGMCGVNLNGVKSDVD